MTKTTVQKQNRPWQFQLGQLGNPKGRPKGCRHRATVAAEALLDGEAEGLTRKAIELALAGDTTALRLCLERILPARKDRPIRLQIPQIERRAGSNQGHGSVARGRCHGRVDAG
jgi:hypothetical protein